MSIGHDFGGEMEELPEKLDSGVGELPVIPAPRVGLGDVLTGHERLEQLHHVQVRHGKFVMLLLEWILLGSHDSILEKLRVDGHAVLLGHQHLIRLGRAVLAH